MNKNTLLITATDTEVGKTVLTTALIAYWQTYCPSQRLGVLKPIQAGIGDRERYTQLFSLDQSLEEINPLYFEAPLAPPVAAELENRSIDLAPVWSALSKLQSQRDQVIVEALGGLGSPITNELIVADLARDWQLPTVLIVPVKLGAIANAVANVALARQMKVNLRGIILNCAQPTTTEEVQQLAPIDLIQSLTQTPILGVIPYLDNLEDITILTKIAANLELEKIIPQLDISNLYSA
ncbi:MAG: dethiobiotin synthase [Microcoleaceae cyanobacterium]